MDIDKNEINQKFEALKQLSADFESDDKETIKGWEEHFKKSSMIAELMDLEGMKMFLAMLNQQIEDIDLTLSNKEDLPEEDRKNFWRIKKWNKKVINFFTIAKSNTEKIAKKVDEELEYQGNR